MAEFLRGGVIGAGVFGAYHAYGGPKQINVYEFNDHEGGEAAHRRRQLVWLPTHLEAL